MSAERDAERVLNRAKKKALRAKLFSVLEGCLFEAEHIERRRDDEDWTCRLSVMGPDGSVLRQIQVTVKTAGPLDFARAYSWDLIAFGPIWVQYWCREGNFTFSENTRKTFGLDG